MFLILLCLQVKKMGSGAIAISLPFSCMLGLLASMTSTTMGNNCFYNVEDSILSMSIASLYVVLISLPFVLSEEKIRLALCNGSV